MRLLIRPVSERPLDRDLAVLDDAERDRAAWYARSRDAAAFVAGRATLRRVVGERLRCAPAAVPLDAPSGRAPVVPGTSIACSVSHGGGLVAVAVADQGRVGVDVERVEGIARPELARIAADVLGAPGVEVEAIRATETGADVFLERWTLTEAVLKAVGTGFAGGAGGVVFDRPPGAAAPRLVAAPGVSSEDARTWTLALLRPAPGHVLALAADRPVAPFAVEWEVEPEVVGAGMLRAAPAVLA